MKTKINDNSWKRIFKYLPVTTVDGYKVSLGHVWVRQIERLGVAEKEYHTNPEGKEDRFQMRHDMELPRLRKTQQNKDRKNGLPITGSNPMPPVKRPKRPPPRPPRPRSVTGTVDSSTGQGRKAEVCSKCGTIDCYSGPTRFKVSGAGVLSKSPSDILQSCKVRQQLRALEKINIGKKGTGSSGPR